MSPVAIPACNDDRRSDRSLFCQQNQSSPMQGAHQYCLRRHLCTEGRKVYPLWRRTTIDEERFKFSSSFFSIALRDPDSENMIPSVGMGFSKLYVFHETAV